MISLTQFIKNTEGKYIDVDGAYGSQCWDYSAYYASQVIGCPSFPTGNGKAIGVFDNFMAPLPQYFTKVPNKPNDPNQFPPVGAIVFWTYNHTGVVIASSAKTMTTLEQDGANDPDQNGIADGVTYRKTRNYTSVAGWFVPKINVKEDEMITEYELGRVYGFYLGRKPDAGGIKAYVGKKTFPQTVTIIRNSAEFKNLQAQAAAGKLGDLTRFLPDSLRTVYKAPVTPVSEYIKLTDIYIKKA